MKKEVTEPVAVEVKPVMEKATTRIDQQGRKTYLMPRKPKLKNRHIFVLTKGAEPKFYMGASASAIAEVMGIHKMTISRGCLLAEQNGGKYENNHFVVYVTNQFIKGRPRRGYFSYQR